MVYTDGIHLVADSLEELHRFARGIGLRKSWFQDKRLPHYDLTTQRASQRAINVGAIVVSSRTIVPKARELYEAH